MTAEATKAPPTKARKKTTPRPIPTLAERKALEEEQLIRWTPDEVVAKKLLPFTSERSIKEKCYRRELYHHRDGGRITFTPDDIRKNSELGAVAPIAA